ncbi:MAG: Fic family protein [Pseudomonadota bacterium]
MDIVSGAAGKVLKASTGYNFFVPNNLPPNFEWTIDLVNSLSKADHVLGQLSREGAGLPNPHLLIRPFIAKEAVLSSKIEGTQATLGEILADEVGSVVHKSPDDLQEVQNYIRALNCGLSRLESLPLSMRLIKEIHAELMQGVRGNATPGELRRTQNWIGVPGCTLNTAKYVPPAPDDMIEALNKFEIFLHDRTLPPLVHIALCHYQFEAIHPFLDGNGRAGRLLITLLLIERKILAAPLLYLSAFFEATQNEYYKQLYNVSAFGTWHDWLTYFLNGVAIQSVDVLSRAERINNLLQEWRAMTVGSSSSALHAIITHFSVNPFLTVNKIAAHLNVAFTTVQRAVNKLEALGIIEQTTPGKRDRVYCAKKIMDILEEPLILS